MLLLVGCSASSSKTEAPVQARIPDVEGVVTAVDTHRIVIDGKRYVVSDDASSVSTYTLKAVPVRVHTYVHAGLDDEGRVRWVATIGLVTQTNPPVVHYTGRLRSARGARAYFEDGTVLRVPADLDLRPGFLAITIDPTTGEITTATTS